MSLEVVTPPEHGRLAEIAGVKLRLKISSDDTSADAQLNPLIESASASVEALCNRRFARRRVIETLRMDGAVAFLAAVPVRRLHALSLDGAVLATPDGSLALDVDLDRDAGVILINRPAPVRPAFARLLPRRLVIDYEGGYDLTPPAPPEVNRPIPVAVRAAVEALIASLWSSSDRTSAVVAERIGDYSVTYAAANANAAVPPEISALLFPFRRLV